MGKNEWILELEELVFKLALPQFSDLVSLSPVFIHTDGNSSSGLKVRRIPNTRHIASKGVRT